MDTVTYGPLLFATFLSGEGFSNVILGRGCDSQVWNHWARVTTYKVVIEQENSLLGKG